MSKRPKGRRMLRNIRWTISELLVIAAQEDWECEHHIEQPRGATSWQEKTLLDLVPHMRMADFDGGIYDHRNKDDDVIWKP